LTETGYAAGMDHVTHPAPSDDGGSPHFVGKDHDSGLSIILVEAEPGNGPRLHRHEYEEVFVVHEGEVTFSVGEAQVQAGPGDVAVAPAGIPHGFVNSGGEPLRMTAIHHSPEFATEWLE
jgi:mannose-6-phosphate isomerase-like protein (cupin superfamily)